MPEPVLTDSALPGPAESIEERESVSLAFLTLLEQLNAQQRVVYVLREGFGLSYDEIALHIEKSPAACRQIFHRARQRLETGRRSTIVPAKEHQRLVEKFLTALAAGKSAELAALLAEDVVWIGDGGAERLTTRGPIVGPGKVARGLAGFARKAPIDPPPSIDIVDINGGPALVIREQEGIERVMAFDIHDGRIVTVRVMQSPTKLSYLDRALQGE